MRFHKMRIFIIALLFLSFFVFASEDKKQSAVEKVSSVKTSHESSAKELSAKKPKVDNPPASSFLKDNLLGHPPDPNNLLPTPKISGNASRLNLGRKANASLVGVGGFDGSRRPPVKVYNLPPAKQSSVDLREVPQAPEVEEPIIRPEIEKHYPDWFLELMRGPSELKEIQDGSDPNTMPNRLVSPSTRAPIGPQSVSFRDAGVCDTGAIPMDTDMDVGNNYIVTDYNSQFYIRSKSGTLVPGYPKTFRSLFSGLPNCGALESSTNFLTDPQVVYDDENDRWVMTMERAEVTAAGAPVQNWLCVAVSQTSDPTASYYTYEINGNYALDDYPHTGIGEDAIFIGTNGFDTSGFYAGSAIYAISKTDAYNGNPITTRITTGVDYTPQPAVRRGFDQGDYPPSGTAHFFLAGSGGATNIWRWPQPTFSSNASIWASTGLPNPGAPVDPNGTFTTGAIDGMDSRFMDAELRWPYLWGARAGSSGGYNLIQWAGWDVSGGSPALYQNGAYSIANKHLWMPDVTVDASNNFAVGVTMASDTPDYPGAWITGREDGITPSNQLESLTESHAGEVVYDSSETPPYRWGDYLGVAIDPDGCTVWFNGQYSENNACSIKQTSWVRNFRFPNCSTVNNLFLDKIHYGCSGTMKVTVEDSTAVSASDLAADVVIDSSTGDSETIPASNWTCIGGCAGGTGTKWEGTLNLSSTDSVGVLWVADGGTITATYNDPHVGHPSPQKTADVECNAIISEYGWGMEGGCDETTTIPPTFHAPDYHSEYYTPHMDNNEVVSYTIAFTNDDIYDLTDVYVQLTVGGAGASYVTVYGTNPVYIGRVPAGDLATAKFLLGISGGPPPLTNVDLTFTITSPADGFTQGVDIVESHPLEADDYVTWHSQCWQHDNTEGWTTGTARGLGACPWGVYTCGPAPTTGCDCQATGSNTHKTNRCNRTFTDGCDEVLYTPIIGPVNTGIEPTTGQQWYWTWRRHSFWFIHDAANNFGQYTNAWGLWYNPIWNSSSPPSSGDDALSFPLYLAYYVLGDTTAWCDPASEGATCDDPANAPSCQIIINLSDIVYARSDSTDYWVYGHEVLDADYLTGNTTSPTRGLVLDNDALYWDEYHAGAEDTACSSQCGVVSFDMDYYSNCSGDTAIISVLDPNGTSPVTVTVTASGTGDSETITLTGTAPYFSANLPISFNSGAQSNDGTLFALPSDTLTATYNDPDDGTGNPCTDTDLAGTNCQSACGDVTYTSNTITDNGDSDAYPDTNETVNMDIQITNNSGQDLTNVVVTIETTTPSVVDCIPTASINYGTITNGSSAWNPAPDQFVFHIDPTVNCTDFLNPPRAKFVVHVTADQIIAPCSLQTITFDVDLNDLSPPYPPLGPVTYDFNTDPGWTVGVGPGDDDGACTTTYTNDFHWCDVCGNGNGGYGAWNGNNPFGTSGQTYSVYSDSVLISPVFTASGTDVTLSFDYAYGTETNYDGAAVYWKKTTDTAWTNLKFNGMVAFNPNPGYCNPLDSGATQAWSDSGPNAWATSNTVTLTGSAGSDFQIRWRLGSDSVYNFAGFGVDNVVISNLAQTVDCDTTDNSALPGCAIPLPPVADNGTAGGSAATFVKDTNFNTNNIINVTYDATTCSGAQTAILYGTIGDYTGYSGCAQPNGGSSGSTTIDTSTINNAWFNIVWTDGAGTAGHPGYGTAGARSWSGVGYCGITADDTSKTTCP